MEDYPGHKPKLKTDEQTHKSQDKFTTQHTKSA